MVAQIIKHSQIISVHKINQCSGLSCIFPQSWFSLKQLPQVLNLPMDAMFFKELWLVAIYVFLCGYLYINQANEIRLHNAETYITSC